MPRSGGNGVLLASGLTLGDTPLFANAGYAYFNAAGEDSAEDPARGLVRVSADGGDLVTFAAGARAVNMAFDATYASWMGSAPGDLDGIFREPFAAGNITVLAR